MCLKVLCQCPLRMCTAYFRHVLIVIGAEKQALFIFLMSGFPSECTTKLWCTTKWHWYALWTCKSNHSVKIRQLKGIMCEHDFKVAILSGLDCKSSFFTLIWGRWGGLRRPFWYWPPRQECGQLKKRGYWKVIILTLIQDTLSHIILLT